MDFDHRTLPWVDAADFEAEASRRLARGELTEDDVEKLRHFRDRGYVTFPGLLSAAQVATLVAEHDKAWDECRPIEALVEGRGLVELPDLPPRHEFGHHHYRLNDLHDVSEPVRETMLHPTIIGFLRLYFDATPVAMQSLFFEYGSEQSTHQDFAYVTSRIPSHLVGCWVACEAVNDDNGPLFYYPGSQRLPKFDWGGGSLSFDGGDLSRTEDFARHIEAEAARAGLERQVFHAQPGDVFLWHGALAHGGSPSKDPNATRKSLVAHYSTRSAYPRERRFRELPPRLDERHGGIIYRVPESGPAAWYLAARKKLKALVRR